MVDRRIKEEGMKGAQIRQLPRQGLNTTFTYSIN